VTWTAEQAAVFLRVKPKTARDLAARRKVPAFKVGSQWRFDETVLREWAQAKARENLAPDGGSPAPLTLRGSIGAPRPRLAGTRSLSERLDELLKKQK
jgi:excisionase family DNA binding protein